MFAKQGAKFRGISDMILMEVKEPFLAWHSEFVNNLNLNSLMDWDKHLHGLCSVFHICIFACSNHIVFISNMTGKSGKLYWVLQVCTLSSMCRYVCVVCAYLVSDANRKLYVSVLNVCVRAFVISDLKVSCFMEVLIYSYMY
jgi:hypothetical protein